MFAIVWCSVSGTTGFYSARPTGLRGKHGNIANQRLIGGHEVAHEARQFACRSLLPRSVGDDVVQLAPIHLPCRRDEQLVIGKERDRFLPRVASPIAQPFDHPRVNGLPHVERRAVTAWSDDPFHTIGGVMERVPTLRLLEHLPRASRGEKVIGC
jgi:hypothetical protein